MSIREIARDRGLKEKTVLNHVKKLVKRGRLSTKWRARSRDQAEKSNSDREVALTKIAEIRRAGQWLNLKGRVIRVRKCKAESIQQIGRFKDRSGEIKFLSWSKSNKAELRAGMGYRLEQVVTDTNDLSKNDEHEIHINRNTRIKSCSEG